MICTVLTDNREGEGLCGEWGLSLHLRHGDHTILLDTGASGLFRENARALGLDLGAVEYGVLSHAHYDHADGMAAFFEVNHTASFYIRRGTRENCFGYHGESLDYIGIRKGTLRAFRDRIVYVKGLYELYPGAYLLGHGARARENGGMFVKRGPFMRPDGFLHEQTLVLEEDGSLAVFSSCSHAGAMTILEEVRRAFPGKRIRALAGGLHLYEAGPEKVRALGRALREDGTGTVITGHCTGEAAYEILAEELGDRLSPLHTGLVRTV